MGTFLKVSCYNSVFNKVYTTRPSPLPRKGKVWCVENSTCLLRHAEYITVGSVLGCTCMLFTAPAHADHVGLPNSTCRVVALRMWKMCGVSFNKQSCRSKKRIDSFSMNSIRDHNHGFR